MSLTYLEGDLLDFPNDIIAIAHSCNCQNRFGKGIALQIKERYPEVYKADTIAAQNRTNKLGKFSNARIITRPSCSVYNLYTQLDTGIDRRRVNYESFYEACQGFRSEMLALQESNDRIIRVGFPYYMSCKNAGGSWVIIEAMLKDLFDRPRYRCFQTEIEAFIVRNPLYD